MVAGVTAMPVLYGLIRWSSDEQGAGSSLERQRESIAACAVALGARLIWLPTLDGVSARHGDNLRHPMMVQFREDIVTGKREIGILCVDEPSRFSRGDYWGTLGYLSPLMERGMQFAVASRKLVIRKEDPSGLLSLFGFLMESEGGHRENEKRVGQVRDEAVIRRAKLKAGTVYSARMPDWLTCPLTTKKGEHDREITKIPARAALALKMMEESVTYGSQRLARLLNDRAKIDPYYQPWRGTSWTADTIKNLTSNRALLGEFQPHEIRRRVGASANMNTRHKRAPIERIPVGDPIPNYFPVIVGMDLWNRVEAAKERRKIVKSGRPSRGNVNLFAGLCHCGSCGMPIHLRGRNARGKNDYLVCSGSLRGVCTNNTNYSLTRLERVFLKHGFPMLTTASDFATATEHTDLLAAQLDVAKQELATALAIQNNVRAALRMVDVGDDDTRAVIMAQLTDETRNIKTAQAERDSIEWALVKARTESPDDAMRQAEALVADAAEGKPEARMALSEIIRAAVARVEFLDGRVYIQPARPMMTIQGNQKLPRRLIVEFGHNARGRLVVDDDETIRIEDTPYVMGSRPEQQPQRLT